MRANSAMPEVKVVLDAVQRAIDSTRFQADSPLYQAAMAQCTAARDDARQHIEQECRPAYDHAWAQCRSERGPAADVLCTDYLREAAKKCESKAEPGECVIAAQVKPPGIKSARLGFEASTARNGSADVSLVLLSGGGSRSSARSSSYAVELVPAPRIKSDIAQINDTLAETLAWHVDSTEGSPAVELMLDALRAVPSGQKIRPVSQHNLDALLGHLHQPDVTPGRDAVGEQLADQLRDALEVSLYAADVRQCSAAERLRSGCGNGPQLILKSATYSFEISYAWSKNAGVTWEVYPAVDLKVGASGEAKASRGNILTIEVGR